MSKTPTLKELREKVSSLVIGQDNLVNTVTLQIYRHILRLYGEKMGIVPSYPNNLLITGESGTGKTFAVRTVCEELNWPLIEINAASLTRIGFKGESAAVQIGNARKKLSNRYSSSSLRQCVVFIDEIDKICQKLASSSDEDYNYTLQCSLLKILEGADSLLTDEVGHDSKSFCFILAGAFSGIEGKHVGIGFEDNVRKSFKESSTKLLVSYGLMPELVGRLSSIVSTEPYTREKYREVLLSEDFVCNKWISYLRAIGMQGEFCPNYSEAITNALSKKLGVRGLISEIEPYINAMIDNSASTLDLDKYLEFIDEKYKF